MPSLGNDICWYISMIQDPRSKDWTEKKEKWKKEQRTPAKFYYIAEFTLLVPL